MPVLHILLPLLISFFTPEPATLLLQQDIAKDYQLLQGGQYFISDNTSSSPSLRTIESDLQLFQVVASVDLGSAQYSTNSSGRHQIKKWNFQEGDLKALYQIESTLALDTTVAVRYLDNKPPTQQHLKNTFRFRTYVVATTSAPDRLLYITEADQGLILYRMDIRQVEMVYSKQKEGLSAALPAFIAEIDQLVTQLPE
ncbi:hypothetical protein FVR03_01985 [Pontibacter qinzhouensis]|uniref:Uncharacterized protein n=1 Tax=Pontibacter qinzhouensis TaxID=2603253 RepID=A0A5C8KAF8_9BACT|nr:hypothetical protein [Pontibacter qinzhouensis]TXK52059.1 hypothetical protein FVR03_01985 [Pontibacter qinzhouensis]